MRVPEATESRSTLLFIELAQPAQLLSHNVGPRQGWLKELKDQVVDLKQQLAVAQQAAHKTVIHIAPSPSGTTIIGQREAHLLQEFLSKGNALITVVPSQTAEVHCTHKPSICERSLQVLLAGICSKKHNISAR